MNQRAVEILREAAETFLRAGAVAQAERALAHWLANDPQSVIARYNYAVVLLRQRKTLAALSALQPLVKNDPSNFSFTELLADILAEIGEYERAATLYAELASGPNPQASHWLGLGHARNALGERGSAASAYRRALNAAPESGAAYWALANLKTEAFSAEELTSMRERLDTPNLAPDDEAQLHFALGKALEDTSDFDSAFKHYAAGGALKRKSSNYRVDSIRKLTDRSISLLTPGFFANRKGMGAPSSAPIFIVGLPRSGSTLVEQILASHSQVEGTSELPEIQLLAREVEDGALAQGTKAYPEALSNLTPGDASRLGEQYLMASRIYRKLGKPRFIDKMPNNFEHTGLIHMILPNSKIIDVRRSPIASCFAAFKQHFAQGQSFSYDLDDLVTYYSSYTELMAHMDIALPGRVHRVLYEELVENPEETIRHLLDHCGLPFEETCVNFHQNSRAVSTPSAQQVRQPIYRDGLDHWRKFEPWLEPLVRAFGPLAR